jgi:dienelactone hydrolase
MKIVHAFAVAWGLAAALAASAAHAQFTPRDLMFDSRSASDLTFPSTVTPIEQATYPQMMLLKPEGEGPFPAVMLGHQCGGLVFNKANPRAANWSMLQWAKDFQQAGYVALLVDFMGPRGATQVCQGAQAGVTLGRTTQDFFQAAEHLRKLPYVDANKVALVGFSQGALIAFYNNSKRVRETMGVSRGFDAYVSFYPLCRLQLQSPARPVVEILQRDIEKPHLMLLGSADTETPAADCESLGATVKASGRPLEFHTYADKTHCWDCKSLNGFTKQGRHGTVTYTYDEETTRDSFERSKAFLARSFTTPK